MSIFSDKLNNLEPHCLAKTMESTVAKLIIPNGADWKNTVIWNIYTYLPIYHAIWNTALNPFNAHG